jgi:hypothetical protein
VHTSRDMIFNEAELAGNISVEGLPQDTTAPTNITTISMLTENKKNKPIAAKIRKTTFKAISKIELPKKANPEAVGVTKTSAKLINVIASRRNPNIVYENLIEENLILSKIIIIKTIPNEDKPWYETAMINFEISY